MVLQRFFPRLSYSALGKATHALYGIAAFVLVGAAVYAPEHALEAVFGIVIVAILLMIAFVLSKAVKDILFKK